MNCDNVIHEKLLEYPMVKDTFSTSHFTIIVGKMGQGKTSLAVSLIKNVFKKCFENIYIFIPSSSRSSIDNDIFGKNLPEDQLYDDLSVSNLEELYEKLKSNTALEENSLVLVDDFQSVYKDKDVSKALETIIIKIRHLRTSVILLAQNFQKIPKPLRELCFNLIVFDLGKSQLLKIFEEVIQVKKEKYDDIVHLAFQEKHDWILINLHRSKKIYRNFDEIIF
jgi:hypothetical protein